MTYKLTKVNDYPSPSAALENVLASKKFLARLLKIRSLQCFKTLEKWSNFCFSFRSALGYIFFFFF